jgi:hypothetical protein
MKGGDSSFSSESLSPEKEEVEEKKVKKKEKEFNIENDPDMPPDAVNSNVIIEEIEMNGKK